MTARPSPHLLSLFVTASLCVCFSVAPVQADVHIVSVEEDWEMVLDNPDCQVVGPQVTTVLSPEADTQGIHMTFEMNHRGMPSFVAGGLQLNIWDNEENVLVRPHVSLEVLSTAGETIRWTQQMSIQGSLVLFEIVNGASTTWGNFGGEGHLKAVVAANVSNLDNYRADTSVQNSGVGFAANRVQSLTLRQVRLTDSNGETHTYVLNKEVELNDD